VKIHETELVAKITPVFIKINDFAKFYPQMIRYIIVKKFEEIFYDSE